MTSRRDRESSEPCLCERVSTAALARSTHESETARNSAQAPRPCEGASAPRETGQTTFNELRNSPIPTQCHVRSGPLIGSRPATHRQHARGVWSLLQPLEFPHCARWCRPARDEPPEAKPRVQPATTARHERRAGAFDPIERVGDAVGASLERGVPAGVVCVLHEGESTGTRLT